MNKLKDLYYKELYLPSWYSIIWNPYYITRRALSKKMKKYAQYLKGKVLDIGCGLKPYETYCNCEEYIGLEIDTEYNRKKKKADVFYDGKVFPFVNESFDGIICNEVFEHVFNPINFIQEVSRVLKNKGIILLSVPFMWDEHEQPFDYGRYTSFGIKDMFEKAGFKIEFYEKSVEGIPALIQLFVNFIYKSFFLGRKVGFQLILGPIIIFPCNLLGLFLILLKLKNQDMFLDNIVLAKKEMQ